MSLIFTGDIAIPYDNTVKILNMPEKLASSIWIGNLEGSLVCNGEKYLSELKVFNDYDAIKHLCEKINFQVFTLANNHLLDAASADITIKNLQTLNKQYTGAGRCLDECAQPIEIADEGKKYILMAFGWDKIDCVYAQKRKEGVNPYLKKNVFAQLDCVKNQNSKCFIVCFFHWDYELEKYPMPYDRDFAHELIDRGVYAVIGCHSHRVQPIEIYKGRPIVYSLGNFMFVQKKYWQGTTVFKDYASKEFAFELRSDGTCCVHLFHYDRNKSIVFYDGSDDNFGKMPYCELNGMTSIEYKIFFKKNKVQNILTPIYYYDDNVFVRGIKAFWYKSYCFLKKRLSTFPVFYEILKKIMNNPQK